MRDASGLSVENRENRWRYAKWHKGKSVVPGLMDWRNKFDTFGSNHHCIQRRQGAQQWVSIAICRLWFKTAFQPVIYGILSKSIHSRTKKNQILSHYVVPSGKHLIANSLIFKYDKDPKHMANPVNAYLDRKTAPLVMDWPHQILDLNFT